VLSELERTRGIDKDAVWSRICDALVKTILTVQPQLSRYFFANLGFSRAGFLQTPMQTLLAVAVNVSRFLDSM
jgi:hypothetical protein